MGALLDCTTGMGASSSATQIGAEQRKQYSQWRKPLMNAKAVALQLTMAALLSSSLQLSTAEAIDSEKQPTYSNIEKNSLCGTDPMGPFPPSPCTVPAGNRLIIEHVSGYVFVPPLADKT